MDRINQYFDGKCTDDEILFRAEITRKQLREVLHHFEEYVRPSPFSATSKHTSALVVITDARFVGTNDSASFLTDVL